MDRLKTRSETSYKRTDCLSIAVTRVWKLVHCIHEVSGGAPGYRR